MQKQKLLPAQAGVSALAGIIIIVAIAIVLFGGVFVYQYLQPAPQSQQQLVGDDRDSHGCIGSAGYSWCEAKQKCLRTWEEPCVEDYGQPIIDSVSPSSGSAGTIVTINGRHFTSGSATYIGISESGKMAWDVNSATDTQIKFTIPSGLSIGAHNISVFVSAPQTPTSNLMPFTITNNQTADWKTYVNQNMGVSVDYLSSWTYQEFSCNLDGVAFCPERDDASGCGQTCGMGSPESPIYIHANGLGASLYLNSANNDYIKIYDDMLRTFESNADDNTIKMSFPINCDTTNKSFTAKYFPPQNTIVRVLVNNSTKFYSEAGDINGNLVIGGYYNFQDFCKLNLTQGWPIYATGVTGNGLEGKTIINANSVYFIAQ